MPCRCGLLLGGPLSDAAAAMGCHSQCRIQKHGQSPLQARVPQDRWWGGCGCLSPGRCSRNKSLALFGQQYPLHASQALCIASCSSVVCRVSLRLMSKRRVCQAFCLPPNPTQATKDKDAQWGAYKGLLCVPEVSTQGPTLCS